jgi:hypothetical protein
MGTGDGTDAVMAKELGPIDHKRLEDYLWAWTHSDQRCPWQTMERLSLADERRCICPDSEAFLAYLEDKLKP